MLKSKPEVCVKDFRQSAMPRSRFLRPELLSNRTFFASQSVSIKFTLSLGESYAGAAGEGPPPPHSRFGLRSFAQFENLDCPAGNPACVVDRT